MTPDDAVRNTDRELFREKSTLSGDPDNYYANSCHVTESGSLGINVGGFVQVMPLKDWHALAHHHDDKPDDAVREALDNLAKTVNYSSATMLDREMIHRRTQILKDKCDRAIEATENKFQVMGYEQGKRDENEACVKVAEKIKDYVNRKVPSGIAIMTAQNILNGIRARISKEAT